MSIDFGISGDIGVTRPNLEPPVARVLATAANIGEFVGKLVQAQEVDKNGNVCTVSHPEIGNPVPAAVAVGKVDVDGTASDAHFHVMPPPDSPYTPPRLFRLNNTVITTL